MRPCTGLSVEAKLTDTRAAGAKAASTSREVHSGAAEASVAEDISSSRNSSKMTLAHHKLGERFPISSLLFV